MAAAMAGGKGKKKKWSKGKSRDQVDNKVLFSKEILFVGMYRAPFL